jgi:hypothetical protein
MIAPPFFRLLVGILAILAATPGGAAAQPQCSNGAPEIILRPMIGVAQLDNTRTQREMQLLAGTAAATHAARTPMTLGLTLTEVIATSRIMAETVTDRLGEGCAAINRLEVAFGFAQHKIYIPQHFAPMSCAYNIIYAHEMRHVETDRALLDSQLPQLRTGIMRALPDMAVVTGGTEAEMTAMLHERIDRLLRRLQSDFIQEREQRQAQVDSPDEYARIAASCEGQLRQRP